MSALPRQYPVVEQHDLDCAYQLLAGRREPDTHRPGVCVRIEVAAQERRHHRFRRAQHRRGYLLRPRFSLKVNADCLKYSPKLARVDANAPAAVPFARVELYAR